MAGRTMVQLELNLPKIDVWFSKGDSTGVIDGPSLLAMQRVILDKRDKMETMLCWVDMGLGLSMGCVGCNSGILDKQMMANVNGPGCPVGSMQSEDKKRKIEGCWVRPDKKPTTCLEGEVSYWGMFDNIEFGHFTIQRQL